MIADIDGDLGIQSAIGGQSVAVSHCLVNDLGIAHGQGVGDQYSAIGGHEPRPGVALDIAPGDSAMRGESPGQAAARVQSVISESTSVSMHLVSS